VLVFASDMLPLEGLPTSGGGLRSWQIIQGLKAHGFDVVFSMPGEDRFLHREYRDRVPRDVLDRCWLYANQDQILSRFKPDAVVFANPDLNCLKRMPDMPVISDFHGPRLIEFELLCGDGSNARRGSNIRRKLLNLMKSDFFTCAGRWQRYYFLSFFLMAGFPLEEIRIAYVPVSLSPELPTPSWRAGETRFLFSGGFYPWQNPAAGLRALSDALRRESKGALEIFGGSHNVNARDAADFAALRRDLEANPRVRFRGYLSRDELIREYAGGHVAFEIMARNFEREMAFTTRTIEFLWAGLPVIYNDYSDLSGYIREYRAGWCMNPADGDAVDAAILEALNEPARVAEYGRNAQRLVRECFTWDRTIQPLVDYLRHPVLARRRPDLLRTPVPYVLGSSPRVLAGIAAAGAGRLARAAARRLGRR
jgi:glycosyltransferase involved in cell wall biosynthesis